MNVRRIVIGIAVMAAAVALQVYLVKHKQNFKGLMTELVKKLPDNMLELPFDIPEYVDYANSYLKNVINDFFNVSESKDDDDEPPKNLNIEKEFIRNFRPPHLEFRIGDVILTHNMIVGVVVGWSIDMADLSKEPVYSLLIENIEEVVKEKQKNMISIENMEIGHKHIEQYFAYYDGIRYMPKRWLLKLYPKD